MNCKITNKDVLKHRTKATSWILRDLVKDIDEDKLIESLFIYSEDAFTRTMLNKYEKQLLIAKLKADDFSRNLHTFFSDMAKYIKKNNLIKNFLFLYYIVFKNQNENALSNNVIFRLYVNMLSQQLSYLAKDENIICGVETKGKPIFIKDPYPYLDYPLIAMDKTHSKPNFNTLKKEFKKFGYHIESEMDMALLFNKYALVSNSIHINSFLIDENTVDMMSSINSIDLSQPIHMPVSDKNIDIDSYLHKRNRFLKNGEIEIDLLAGEIRKIELKEVFFQNNLYLLYKITNVENKSFTGFYDIEGDFFVSPYTGMPNFIDLQNQMRNLILESYIICTCDIDRNDTRFYDLHMHINENPNKDINAIKRYYKRYNRDNLIAKSTEINSYIRKLPVGSTASQEAIENAQRYGIMLKPGETFVKAFEKTIYKKR